MKTEKQSPACKRYVSVRRVEDNVGFWAFFTWVDGNNNHKQDGYIIVEPTLESLERQIARFWTHELNYIKKEKKERWTERKEELGVFESS